MASISAARARASRRETPSCSRTVSPIWRPVVSTGLRLVIGSWKIMLISLPRIARKSRFFSDRRLRRSNCTSPMTLAGGSFRSRRIENAVTDLPQPDLPKRATVSPAPIEKERPSTARTVPSGVRNSVCRLCTSRSVTKAPIAPRGSGRRSPSAPPVKLLPHRYFFSRSHMIGYGALKMPVRFFRYATG